MIACREPKVGCEMGDLPKCTPEVSIIEMQRSIKVPMEASSCTMASYNESSATMDNSNSSDSDESPRKKRMTLGRAEPIAEFVTFPGENTSGVRPLTDTTLMLSQHKKLDLFNFKSEIPASRDVERLLRRCNLLLDINETDLTRIIKKLLRVMLEHSSLGHSLEMVKSSFFTEDSVHCLASTIQGTEISEGGGWEQSQNWFIAMSELVAVKHRSIGIARLKHPVNLGRTLEETQFIILVLGPIKTKSTKTVIETGRNIGTLFADPAVRQWLLEVKDQEEFMSVLADHRTYLTTSGPSNSTLSTGGRKWSASQFTPSKTTIETKEKYGLFQGIVSDVKRRLPFYWQDYADGLTGHKTLHKLTSTIVFLYFACILPSIAFGALNSSNTNGQIDVYKVFISQTIGGIVFSVIGGQPLIILLTTAPLALYTKVIYNICSDFDLDFFAMYACVGLSNSFFLVIYAVTGASRLVKWSTRSTEEIFGLFISIAFVVSAITAVVTDFQDHYDTIACKNSSSIDSIKYPSTDSSHSCNRDISLLYILLAFGTVSLGQSLYQFKQSPFLDENKREILADYALPMAVLAMSFLGSFVFSDVKIHSFTYNGASGFHLPVFSKLSVPAIFAACGLGFSLSMLFFIDQNISSAMVNNPNNKLRKGCAYHWDLLVVALINGFLSLFGFPMVHGALPHSPLHVRALADVEQRVDQGHVHEIIVKVRETRLSGLISHILIGLSIMMLPNPLQYIPKAVLDGLFLYMAITALYGNQLFERALLLIKEQSAYPPNHYIRRVPQAKIHAFTFIQIFQLIVVCAFGFAPYPYLKMTFPLVLLMLLPIRHKLVPKIIEHKYLHALDPEM